MMSDELDVAEREMDVHLWNPEQLRPLPSRSLFSFSGDSVHLPLGQRMRVPEREDDGDV